MTPSTFESAFFLTIGVVLIIAVYLLWIDWREQHRVARANRYLQHRQERLSAAHYREVPRGPVRPDADPVWPRRITRH